MNQTSPKEENNTPVTEPAPINAETEPAAPEAQTSVKEPSDVPDAGGAAAAKKPFDLTRELYEWLEVVVIAITVVLLVFTFVGRVATVVGGSMLPTLTGGERLVVRELGYRPAQGDIIVCQSEPYGLEEPLVKRIIALAGQTVTIDFQTWTVRVDGEELEEDYILYQEGLWMNGWDYGESYTVPEGHVFVMGDNRNNSTDSRRASVGPIDERLILGKAIFGISKEHGFRSFGI